MMDAMKLQSWSETPEPVRSRALCKLKTGPNCQNELVGKTFSGFGKKMFQFGLGLICLVGFVPSVSGQAPAINQATTPWTNTSGQAVSSAEEKSLPLPVSPSSESYNGIKTTELTITPLQMDSPPIRLTQGIIAKESMPPATTNKVQKEVSLPVEPAASSEAPQSAPRLAQSSGIPQPGERNRTNRFLPADSALLRPDTPLPNGQQKDRKITLPDGRQIDLSETENITLPQDRRMIPFSTQQQLPEEKASSGTTDSHLGPQPVASPIIASPSKHRSVFGFGRGFGRNADGSMNGNPYAIAEANDGTARCAAANYHPGQIPFDPVTEGRTRLTIPEGAYGSDGWGNDGTACLMDGNCSGCGLLFQNMQFGVGILGYTTPMDALGQGNFGADISLNWATPRRWLLGLSAQAGGRLTTTGQNGIHGSSLAQDKGSTQFFWTSGLFFRNPCSPWQLGLVYDSLNSSYLSDYTIGQIRTELSHKLGERTDLGFLGAFRVNDSMVNWWRINDAPVEETIKPVSWYSGFIRHYFEMGGEGMLYAGVTENSESLIGGRIEVPISNYFSLKNDFVYVFTKEKGLAGQDERSWNVSITLTLYMGGNCRESLNNPLRPLFDVANNSSFLQSGAK